MKTPPNATETRGELSAKLQQGKNENMQKDYPTMEQWRKEG